MKTGKNFKCWGTRCALAGDLIFSLPILNYLELKYPNSYKYFAIAKKCSQFAPIFLNHPFIDRIKILENSDTMGTTDYAIANECQLVLDINPQHPDGPPGTTEKSCWWNYYNVFEETFRMAGFDVEAYRAMPKELQYPRLIKWFSINEEPKTIGIWPFSSYGTNSKRSPSIEWWQKMVHLLRDNNYKILHFGGQNEPSLAYDFVKYNSLSYRQYTSFNIFDQIKMSLGCQLNINTNSGSGSILGTYGVNQITLLTDDAPNHYQNLLAFAPLNYNNKNTNIFQHGGFDGLNQEKVLEAIRNHE